MRTYNSKKMLFFWFNLNLTDEQKSCATAMSYRLITIQPEPVYGPSITLYPLAMVERIIMGVTSNLGLWMFNFYESTPLDFYTTKELTVNGT